MSHEITTMVRMTSRIIDELDSLRPQSPDTLLSESLLLGFDTETTGLAAGNDAIVSASLVLRNPTTGFEGDLADSWLINPHRPISPGASAVNGLSDNYVAEHGSEPMPSLDAIADTIAAAQRLRIPLVAYNAPFDVRMLQGDLTRWRLRPLESRIAPSAQRTGSGAPGTPLLIADPLVFDRALSHRHGSHRLSATTEYYGIYPHGDFHDASTDTVATLDLVGPMTRLYPQLAALSLGSLMEWQTASFAQWKSSYNEWAKSNGRRPRTDTWF